MSWLTGYDAAGAIVDMLDVQSDVLHLVHPKPANWSSIIKAFSRELGLPTGSFSEWLEKLENAYTNMQNESSDAAAVERHLRENPALSLINYFRKKKRSNGPFAEPFQMAKIGNDKAVEASQTLRQSKPINDGDVRRWVSYWRKTGFLPSFGNNKCNMM